MVRGIYIVSVSTKKENNHYKGLKLTHVALGYVY